jgi:hypothetical protein
MTHTDDHHARQRELADLQQDFPAYRIWREALGDHVRLVAVTRQPGASPHTVVTADVTELRTALTRPASRTSKP